MFGELGLPASTPYWVVIGIGLVMMFRREIGQFFPAGLQEYFRAKAKEAADQREHTQEIEDVSTEVALQHAVSAQLQLIKLNEVLVEFVTTQLMDGVKEIQVEMARVSDVLAREEVVLRQIEALMSD